MTYYLFDGYLMRCNPGVVKVILGLADGLLGLEKCDPGLGRWIDDESYCILRRARNDTREPHFNQWRERPRRSAALDFKQSLMEWV